MATEVRVVVNGLAGPRCTLEACTEWSILQVHVAICEKIGVPVDWQTLLKDTEKLSWEVTVGSFITEGVESLELTLLVEEVPEPEPFALHEAIRRQDEATALQLLRRYQLPGLNNVSQGGWTVLSLAICMSMPEVAMALITRPGFSAINVANDRGWTALHCAAASGLLPVCRAILGRTDFNQLLTINENGETALQVARVWGHEAEAEFLQAAEAQLRKTQGVT